MTAKKAPVKRKPPAKKRPPVNNRKGGKPRNAREQQVIDERRIEVERLDLAGLTEREIAEQLKVAKTTVHRDLEHVRKSRREELSVAADTERDKELARLERLWSRWIVAAERGDDRAAAILLRIADRKAKLLGLDAPVRSEVTGADGGPLIEGLVTGLSTDQLIELAQQRRDLPDLDDDS